MTEPIRIGDFVVVDGESGRVEDIRLSLVVIRTGDERRLIVPTSKFLDATFQIDLGPTLEEALTRGVTLHFVTEFELLYERWYFLNLWNKTISTVEQRYRLNYNALTRHYRLSTGALTLSLETLHEALALMGRLRGQQIATRDQLDPSLVYTAQIRLRIDTAQLPKPFQISSIGSKTWNLSSDWYRWTVKP